MLQYQNIQQRVFCIFIRPVGLNSEGRLLDFYAEDLFFKDSTITATYKADGTIDEDFAECKKFSEDCYYYDKKAFDRGKELVQFQPFIEALNSVDDSDSESLRIRKYAKALNYNNDTKNTSAEVIPFNSNMTFKGDIWMLHSTWTSFDKAKEAARKLIDAFGFDNIMLQAYVPLDLELLPNK